MKKPQENLMKSKNVVMLISCRRSDVGDGGGGGNGGNDVGGN